MRKSQYYILAVATFLLSLFFGGMANNRKNICDQGVSLVYDYCMQRHTTFVILGVLLFVSAIVFFIFGLFEKSSGK